MAESDQDDSIESICAVLELTAGLIPGRPDPEYTQRRVITSREWHATPDADKIVFLAIRLGEMHGKALALSVDIGRINWVRVDWLWL